MAKETYEGRGEHDGANPGDNDQDTGLGENQSQNVFPTGAPADARPTRQQQAEARKAAQETAKAGNATEKVTRMDESGDDADYILVQAGPGYEGRVALFDADPAHPNGEVFVTGSDPGPQKVAETGRVNDALRRGALVRAARGARAWERPIEETPVVVPTGEMAQERRR